MPPRLAQIDYAPPPAPLLQRPKVKRFLVRAGIAAGCIFVLFWTPFLVRNAERILWQWQCMNHIASPGAIALEFAKGNITPDRRHDQPDASLLLPLTISPRDQRVLFLHERHLPGDPKRLVVVSLDARDGLNFVVAQVVDVSVFRGIRPRNTSTFLFPELGGGFESNSSGTFRLYEARPDAIDPTHFTIEYERDYEHGIIDGWLTKTESISLELRRK